MTVYKGLTRRYEVTSGERTPATPGKRVPTKHKPTSARQKTDEVSREMVFPFSAQKCFDMVTDYRKLLLSLLKDNERIAVEKTKKPFCADPSWQTTEDPELQGGVGSMIKYAYYMDKVIYWMVDKIVTVEDGVQEDETPGRNKIFRFSVETQSHRTTPQFALEGYSSSMIFTTFDNDPNQCHMKWIKKWNRPFSCVRRGIRAHYKQMICDQLKRDLDNFWILLHATYSEKLPKKDSKVLVIGAGPSGLHMSYELIQRGISEQNITILEKDNRYGGKTLSIESGTNVQISDAKYNPPAKGPVRSVLKKFYTCEPIRDAVTLCLSPSEKPELERSRTPGALQYQPPGEYFKGGEKIFHEMGTCYLSPGYYAVRSLLKTIQQEVEKKAELEDPHESFWKDIKDADMTREVGPETYAFESTDWEGAKTLTDWIEYAAKDYVDCCSIFNFCSATRVVAVNASILKAKLTYCKLHIEYLGNFSYSLPPRPDDASFADLVVPFSEYLRVNDLLALEPLFTYALTAQGYGIIQTTPAFLAMQWLTPDLLDGYFEWHYFFLLLYKNPESVPKNLKKFNNMRKSMLVSGWGGLWDRIVALYDLEPRIKYETTIHNITRNDGKVQVQYTHDSADYDEEYDFLIVGAPLSDAAVDSTVQTLPLDLDEVEEDLFLTKDLKAAKFKTTLFKPEANGNYERDHLRIFIDAILNDDPEKVGKGGIYGVRDSYKAVQPKLSTVGGDKYDPARDQPREKMCYQYVSPENAGNYESDEQFEQETSQIFNDFMLDHPDYFADIEGDKIERIRQMYISSRAWTYYTHYEGDGLSGGKLWKILDIQGKRNTLFVHASTNFESVLDIVNYNHMILDGLAGRLDNFIPPESDTRPTPEERPQVLLLNRLKFAKVCRYAINFLCLIFWVLWYFLSYPLAEGVYLRYKRYKMHKKFKIPKLGWPWQYTMKRYLKDTPLARGYVDYTSGNHHGIPSTVPDDYDPCVFTPEQGPGDTVFKILQDPKYKFPEKHPEIPNSSEIPAMIFMNLADMRVSFRYWISVLDCTPNIFFTPCVRSLIQNVSYYFPNYYSLFFSWVLASRFRMFFGFSYRFEDKLGGGLRIPDCHMLRVSIDVYGQEAGQRIFLAICKIFTEEALKQQKLKIDFRPDFIKGTGRGCTVRFVNPVNHAFSNHSLYKFRNREETEAFQNVASW